MILYSIIQGDNVYLSEIIRFYTIIHFIHDGVGRGLATLKVITLHLLYLYMYNEYNSIKSFSTNNLLIIQRV